MAAHAGRRVPPDPDHASTTSPTTSPTRSGTPRRRSSTRHGVAKYLLSRAVRDAGLQGRADRRRVRRDPRRLSPLPPRHAALRPQRPGSRRGRAAPAGASWRRPTRSRAACCCPTARRCRWRACAARSGFVPSLAGGATPRSAGSCAALLARTSPPSSRERDPYSRLLDGLDVPGQLAGRDAGEPVALPLVQDDAAQLHPDRAGRPHGDGALGGGARAVPGSPRRRAARATCRSRRRSAG